MRAYDNLTNQTLRITQVGNRRRIVAPLIPKKKKTEIGAWFGKNTMHPSRSLPERFEPWKTRRAFPETANIHTQLGQRISTTLQLHAKRSGCRSRNLSPCPGALLLLFTFLCTRLRSSWMPSRRKLMSSLASCCWWPANIGAYCDTTFFRVLGTTTEYSPDHACGATSSGVHQIQALRRASSTCSKRFQPR